MNILGKVVVAVGLGVVISGCASYKVTPLAPGMESRQIVVIDNPRVIMDDFGPRLAKEFESRGFKAYAGNLRSSVNATNCLYATYAARRSFNLFAPYPWFTFAEITLSDARGIQVARGVYRHRACFWSLAFKQFCRCSRTKMRPLFAEMFQCYPRQTDEEF